MSFGEIREANVTINNDEAGADAKRSDGDGSLVRAILSLKPWVVTAAYLSLSLWPMFTPTGSLAGAAASMVLVFALGGWWWAIVRTVMRARPTPTRRWPWLLVAPLVWMPVQWLAERWLGPMDGDLSPPQVAFEIVSMFVAGILFYGFWRFARAFEEAALGEKPKAEQVLATALQLLFVPIGVWTLNAKIRRVLSLAV